MARVSDKTRSMCASNGVSMVRQVRPSQWCRLGNGGGVLGHLRRQDSSFENACKACVRSLTGQALRVQIAGWGSGWGWGPETRLEWVLGLMTYVQCTYTAPPLRLSLAWASCRGLMTCPPPQTAPGLGIMPWSDDVSPSLRLCLAWASCRGLMTCPPLRLSPVWASCRGLMTCPLSDCPWSGHHAVV